MFFAVLNTANICASIGQGPPCTIISDGFIPKNSGPIRIFNIGDAYYMAYAIVSSKDKPLSEEELFFIELCRKQLSNK